MGLGMFAGGLAQGVGQGMRLGMMAEAMQENKELRDLEKENKRMDLDRKKRDEEALKAIEQAGRDAYSPPQPSLPADGSMGEPPKPDNRSDPERLAAAFEARYRKAVELGRADLAIPEYKQAAAVREKWRGDLLAAARVRYSANGDVTGYIDAYNKTVPDGSQIVSWRRNADGDLDLDVSHNGSDPTRMFVPYEKVGELVAAMEDPETVRKVEILRLKADIDARSPETAAKVDRDRAAADKDRATAEYYRGARTEESKARATRSASGWGGRGTSGAGRRVQRTVENRDGSYTLVFNDGTSAPLKDDAGNVVKGPAAAKLAGQLVGKMIGDPLEKDPVGRARGIAGQVYPDQAPSAPPQYREGQTATNPQTGAKLIYRNGQWVPQ